MKINKLFYTQTNFLLYYLLEMAIELEPNRTFRTKPNIFETLKRTEQTGTLQVNGVKLN